MVRKTSTGRILKSDYPSLLLLILIGVAWVIAIIGGVFDALPQRGGAGITPVDQATKWGMFVIAGVLTLVCGWFASQRIKNIKRIISDGIEVKGRIQSIYFARDRGRVEYDYEYNGQAYHAGNAIWKNRETTKLSEGDDIDLIVDSAKPSRAFIKTLYTVDS